MAKLKISNVIRLICDTCNGNGFIKIQDPEDKTEINVHQCWDCDSEGEFYVHEPQAIQPDHTIDPVTGDVVKLN